MEKRIKEIKKMLADQIKGARRIMKELEYLRRNARKRSGKSPSSTGKMLKIPNGQWNDFVFDTIGKTGKLHTGPMLVKMAHSKLKKSIKGLNEEQVRSGIARVLSRHEKRSKKLIAHNTGVRPVFYGLPEWFDKNGKLKPAYTDKLVGLKKH
ncbi:MAG: hypothetical protein ACJ76F_02995 [Bacteroidia bacterium]